MSSLYWFRNCAVSILKYILKHYVSGCLLLCRYLHKISKKLFKLRSNTSDYNLIRILINNNLFNKNNEHKSLFNIRKLQFN